MSLPKKKSLVWNYFSDTGSGMAKCNFCSKKMSYKGGSTFNLNRHLKSQHPSSSVVIASDQQRLSTNVAGGVWSDDNIPGTSSCSSTAEKEPNSVDSIPETRANQSFDTSSIVLPAQKKSKVSTITQYMQKPVTNRKREELNKLLVIFLVKNYLPFQLVEDQHFKNFVLGLNSGYQFPARKTVSKVLIPQMYNLLKDVVKMKIQKVEAVCLTTDAWTSSANESYLSVTAHFVNNDTLESALLECYKYCESHTANNLSAELNRVAQDWQIVDKVSAIVSDNASNIVAAVKQTGWTNVKCFAHTTNLIVQTALCIEEIKPIHTKVKKIVEFFKRSTRAYEKLKAMQIQMGRTNILNVKQDVITRWNSTYDMFARILEIKESIMSTIAINYPEMNNLTNDDIIVLEQACDILKTFKQVTEEISSSRQVTISKIIIISCGLKKICQKKLTEENLPEVIKKFTESLLESINKRFANIEHNRTYADGTILDPRFKKHGFSEAKNYEAAKQNLINYVLSTEIDTSEKPDDVIMTPSNATSTANTNQEQSQSKIWEEFDSTVLPLVANPNPRASAIVEVEKYLDEPLLPRSSDPLYWWKERKTVYPRLYALMKKKLCIVGSSVPCERIFSKAGQTITDRRARLTGEKVGMLLFLHENS